MRHDRIALALLGLVAAGCLSANPPPQVRWFDPSTDQEGDADSGESRAVLLHPVTASLFLRQDMVWRIAPREFYIDELNRWVAEPGVLVQQALEQALFAGGAFRRADSSRADDEIRVHVLAFEGDLTASPRARVRLVLRVRGRAPEQVEATAPAAGDRPGDLADAVATALRDAACQVRDRLSR